MIYLKRDRYKFHLIFMHIVAIYGKIIYNDCGYYKNIAGGVFMKRKISLFLLCVCFLFLNVNETFAQWEPRTDQTASPSEVSMSIDGKDIQLYAYLINDSNYVKARDLAVALAGTRQQFLLQYSGSVYLYKTFGEWEKYQPDGSEGKPGDRTLKTAHPMYVYACVDSTRQTTSLVNPDSLVQEIEGYIINDYTYVKLRDVAEKFDFLLEWDGAANQITIDTEASYLASDYIPPKRTDTKVWAGKAVESSRMLFINEMPILSYEIGDGMVYIVAEDLENYGFDVSWESASRTLSLAYCPDKVFGMMDGVLVNGERGTLPASDAYTDNTRVLIDGVETGAYSLDGRMLIPITTLYPYGVFSYGLDPDQSYNPIATRINIDFLKLELAQKFESAPKDTFTSTELRGVYDSKELVNLNAGIERYGMVYYQTDNSLIDGMVSFDLYCSTWGPIYYKYLGYFDNDKMNGKGIFYTRTYCGSMMYTPREKNKFERGIYRDGALYDGISYASGGMPGINPDGKRTEGAMVNGYQRQCIVENRPQKKTRFGYRVLCEGEVQNGEFCGYFRAYDDGGHLSFEGQYSDYNDQ